ncbi:MAG: hypothetical protein ACOVNZ_04365 [Crocinitomicaceae bacterium]|jgi:hypothetical protein
MNPLFLSLLLGSALGGINYLYWRSKGYKSVMQLVMSVFGFTALVAAVLRIFS